MIVLPWPPTVNNYYTVARNRKILSKRGREYKAWASSIIGWQLKPLVGDVCIFIRAYPPDRRRRDLDNLLKPALDVLTECNVYGDDYQVADLRIQRFNPAGDGRLEIQITGTSDEQE